MTPSQRVAPSDPRTSASRRQACRSASGRTGPLAPSTGFSSCLCSPFARTSVWPTGSWKVSASLGRGVGGWHYSSVLLHSRHSASLWVSHLSFFRHCLKCQQYLISVCHGPNIVKGWDTIVNKKDWHFACLQPLILWRVEPCV